MESIGSDLETMKRVPLADAHVAALSEIGEERWYAKGEMIARVGERCFERSVDVLKSCFGSRRWLLMGTGASLRSRRI